MWETGRGKFFETGRGGVGDRERTGDRERKVRDRERGI